MKSKTGNQWPKVSGIWAPGDLLVFVDFKGKDLEELPDFYVLNVKQWKELAQEIVQSKSDGAKLDKENTVYWEPWEGNPKGWKGCSISTKQVQKYKDRWPKLPEA